MPNFDDIDLTNVIMDGDPYGNFEDPSGGGDEGSPILLGTCATAAATAAKVVILTDVTDFELTNGTVIAVKFTDTNTAQNPTLNVNGTGAKSVYYNTSVVTTGSLSVAGTANRYIEYMYDGTNWVWIGWGIDTNTTYSAMSKSELTTGTAITSRVVRADYLKSAILSLANPIGTIIHSTTCDTMAKVVAAYGGTTWIQHTGYILRGASSGVTDNNAVKDGGEDTHTLTINEIPAHTHGSKTLTGSFRLSPNVVLNDANSYPVYNSFTGICSQRVDITQQAYTGTSFAPNGYRITGANIDATHEHTSVGGNAAHNIMQSYKNVYIWERVS